MHERLHALFSEHATPTHLDKQAAHARLEPVTEIVADIQKQLIVYRQLIRKAKLAQIEGGHEWAIEHIDQTFRLLQTHVEVLETSAMVVADGIRQLDRYLAEAKQLINDADARAAAAVQADVTAIEAGDVDAHSLDAIATDTPAR